MKSLSKLILFLFVSNFVAGGMNGQEVSVSPTPPLKTETEECGLLSPTLLKLRVSVWHSGRKAFINDLHYTNFEINDRNRVREIDYFMKPDSEATELNRQNQYTIGFTIDHWEEKDLPDFRVKVKNGSRNLVIKVSPDGFIR